MWIVHCQWALRDIFVRVTHYFRFRLSLWNAGKWEHEFFLFLSLNVRDEKLTSFPALVVKIPLSLAEMLLAILKAADVSATASLTEYESVAECRSGSLNVDTGQWYIKMGDDSPLAAAECTVEFRWGSHSIRFLRRGGNYDLFTASNYYLII